MDSSDDQALGTATGAAGRLFRAYGRHCQAPNPDTLFDLLTAMHSLSDRLQKAIGRDFHVFQEFVALKAIRNLAHHQEELWSNIRIIPVPVYSDLAMMCIVRRDQVERAIQTTAQRWREETRSACEAVFHWYGPAININPCVFNFVVKAYEMLTDADVRPPEEDLAEFAASYRYEKQHGYSHCVDGKLSAPVAEISGVLEAVVAEMPPPS